MDMNHSFLCPSLESQYRDLRSASHPRKRLQKQSSNYYGCRGVKPGWIGQPYYSSDNPQYGRHKIPVSQPIAHLSDHDPPIWVERGVPHWQPTTVTCIRIWTKKDMWNDSGLNIWPLDIRHHEGRWKRERFSRKYEMRKLGRSMKQRQELLNDWQEQHRTGYWEGYGIPDHWIWQDERDLPPTAPPSPSLHGSCVWEDEPVDEMSLLLSLPDPRHHDGVANNAEREDSDFDCISELDFDVISLKSGSTDWDVVSETGEYV